MIKESQFVTDFTPELAVPAAAAKPPVTPEGASTEGKAPAAEEATE